MKILKKEITTKKTIGKELLESVIYAVCFTVVLYFCLSTFNEPIQTYLTAITDGKISALTVTLIIFPAILILSILCKFATIAANSSDKK